MHLPTKNEILEAKERLDGVIYRTPLVPLFGPAETSNIFLKMENLQRFGSFKLRAAANAIKSLPESALQQGVVTASAGNFGQGLCAAANLLGVKASVIVPDVSAQTKLDALEALGASIHRINYSDWWDILATRKTNVKGHFIHPVCEQAVLAGNATIGLEIAEDLPDVDMIAVPVGGGGLAVGIGAGLQVFCAHRVSMLASESDAARPVAAALRAGEPQSVDYTPSFIDGMGGKTVLPDMWPLLRSILDGSVTCSLEEIAAAIRYLVLHHHVVAEGAGAASLAAALNYLPKDKKIVCILSGGNIDVANLSTILQGNVPVYSDQRT